MRRSYVVALLGGLGIGIGIGVLALFLVMNRVQMAISPPAAPIVTAAPTPPPVAPAKPTVHARLRKPKARAAPQTTADARRTAPPAPSLPSIQMGDGTIFSGADPNDPRIYHFSD